MRSRTGSKKFEKKVREYSEEAEPSSNIRKPGKLTTEADFAIKSSVGPGVHLPSFDPISLGGQVLYIGSKKVVDSYLEERHREKAKGISKVICSFECNKREVLVKAGLEIFQKFEEQFTRVIDVGRYIQGGSEERAIQKLAIDAAYRVVDYASDIRNIEKSFFDFITKGVVLGKSKRETVAKSLHLRPAGYKVKDRQSGKTWLTSELYGNTGIKKMEDGITKYYVKRGSNSKECSYRLPFAWELEKWRNESIDKEYTLVMTPEEQYVYILDNGKKEKLAPVILKELNEQDLINTEAMVVKDRMRG